jgi:hypothetical protein
LDGNEVVRVCDDFIPEEIEAEDLVTISVESYSPRTDRAVPTETDSPVSTNSGKRAPDQD